MRPDRRGRAFARLLRVENPSVTLISRMRLLYKKLTRLGLATDPAERQFPVRAPEHDKRWQVKLSCGHRFTAERAKDRYTCYRCVERLEAVNVVLRAA